MIPEHSHFGIPLLDVYKRQEYLKQLEDENLRLRIENAYLKELRRCVEETGLHLYIQFQQVLITRVSALNMLT